MEPNANNSQRLFPFQHVHVLKTFPSIQSVPRIHQYLPKLSRIKAHQDFPKLAKITQLIPTAIRSKDHHHLIIYHIFLFIKSDLTGEQTRGRANDKEETIDDASIVYEKARGNTTTSERDCTVRTAGLDPDPIGDSGTFLVVGIVAPEESPSTCTKIQTTREQEFCLNIHSEIVYLKDFDRAKMHQDRARIADGQETHTEPDKEHTDLPNGESDQVKEMGFIFSLEIKYSKVFDRGKSPHDRPSSRDGPWSLPASHLSPNHKLSLNGSLENHVWRPGDILNQLEALQYVPNSAKTHRISWIQCKLYFPEMEPNANNSQRLFPFQHVHVLKTFPSIQSVPRIHQYLPKLSRIKAHQDFPYLAKILSLMLQRPYSFNSKILFLS